MTESLNSASIDPTYLARRHLMSGTFLGIKGFVPIVV
jgi:hypothetical protein